MPVIVALLTYAALLGIVADRLLVRASWVVRFPRVALRMWHICAFTFLGTVAAVPLLGEYRFRPVR